MVKIKEIIVVEGRDDTAKVRQAVDADTIETNGSAVSKAVLGQIQHAKAKRGVIIFTDPDYPGERIRHIIDEAVPGCKHAFLKQKDARSSHARHPSLGIEHASVEMIQKALADVYELAEVSQNDISRQDLIDYGLIGGKQARFRRERLSSNLQIGYTNGKQLLKRLRMFEITRSQFEQALEHVLQEEHYDGA